MLDSFSSVQCEISAPEQRNHKPHIYFPAVIDKPDRPDDVRSYERRQLPICCEDAAEGRQILTELQQHASGYVRTRGQCKFWSNLCMSPGAEVFWGAFRDARECVYLLDGDLDEQDFARILYELADMCNTHEKPLGLRIIVISDAKAEFQKIFEAVDEKFPKGMVELLATPAYRIFDQEAESIDWCHDRFALVDDSVWHFGAKIAGMYKGMNAFSGPWQDINGAFRSFLELVANSAREGKLRRLHK